MCDGVGRCRGGAAKAGKAARAGGEEEVESEWGRAGKKYVGAMSEEEIKEWADIDAFLDREEARVLEQVPPLPPLTTPFKPLLTCQRPRRTRTRTRTHTRTRTRTRTRRPG